MNYKRSDHEAIRQNAESAEMYQGVEAFGFHSFESNAQYHAIGVYKVNGKLTARWHATTFSGRAVADAKSLYLATISESNQAAYILSHYSGLPPVLSFLVERAEQEELIRRAQGPSLG